MASSPTNPSPVTLHVCDCHLIRHIFIPIFRRLGRTAQIFFKGPFFTSKAGQGQSCRQRYRTLPLHPALPQFFGDGCKCQQIVILAGGLIPLQRLPSRPTHIPSALVFQHILPGVGFMVIRGDPRWEHTMPRFHGVVAMVDSNDRLIDFSLSFLATLEEISLFLFPSR